MYEEKITINDIVFRRFRKKMADIREFYSDMGVTFVLNGEIGNQYLKIYSSGSDDFNQAVKEIKIHINKFIQDFEKRQSYKKIEKEKLNRKRIKTAEKQIKKNIKEYEEKKDIIQSDEVHDSHLKNNMFYGLKIDVPCLV